MANRERLLGLLLVTVLLGMGVASWQKRLLAEEKGEANHLLYLPLVSYLLDYRVEAYPGGQDIEEYRLFCGDKHFLSVIIDNGTFNLRPHPGEDINGWGSSLYLQPFFPGAVLTHSSIPIITATDYGIEVEAGGAVSLHTNETYGSWTASLALRCHPLGKMISGDGTYQINLDGPMATHGDLNLYRIASNYLVDVPLLSGGSGNTGDMEKVHYAYDGGVIFDWNLIQNSGHFPADEANQLMVEVVGACNEVDTAAQGYAPIAAAAKPGLKLVLTSQVPSAKIRFGAFYDISKNQDFWEDNVGVTPLINSNSTDTAFTFDIDFMATSIPSDGQIPCWSP